MLDTTDDENVRGRGAAAVDPYQADRSNVIKLGLQIFNGCAIKANGTPVGPGAAAIPYPDECENFNFGVGNKVPPGEPMELLTDTDFFLDKLSLVQVVRDLHTDPKDMQSVMEWIRTESDFAALDWSNLTVQRDRWQTFGDTAQRQVHFGGANWQTRRAEQTFTLELLNQDGNPIGEPVVYSRNDLIAENSTSGRTQILWEVEGVENPTTANQVDITPGPFGPPIFTTLVKLEFAGSAKPFTTLHVPASATGDGAIKVTWSAMPEKPFYFPVRYISEDELPDSCFDASGAPTNCRYGLDSEVKFDYPEGRKHFVPGEVVSFNVSLKDSLGNYLHPATGLPSYDDYFADTANGLLYYNNAHFLDLYEWDTTTAFKITGPLHKMREGYQEGRPFFEWPELFYIAPSLFPGFGLFPGGTAAPLASKYKVQLPEDAEPGTYVLQVKANRAWMGERVSKLQPYYFQVGPSPTEAGAPTTFPGRVGNCQICHRGVLSLDNLRHGAAVDVVEGCKGCHNQELFETVLGADVHAIHQFAQTYPLAKNDCTVCHLTRESATRPSYAMCSTCHIGLHGDSYFQLEITYGAPKYGNCAESCHAVTPPASHILPAE